MRTPVSTRVNATKLARHFGVTATHIRRLAKEAIVALESDGKYDQDKSRLAYFSHLRSQRNIKAEGDASYRKLKNRKLQMEIAQLDGRLIELEEVMTLTDYLIGSFRQGLDGMAARVTTDRSVRAKIEDIIREILTGLANANATKAALLKSGGSLIAEEVEDAADDEAVADGEDDEDE
jgi:hypothetical protein